MEGYVFTCSKVSGYSKMFSIFQYMKRFFIVKMQMGKTYNYSRELNGVNCNGASLVVFQEGEKSWPLLLYSDCLIRPLKVKLPLIRKII